MKKTTLTDVNTYLIIALLIVVGVGLYFTVSTPKPEKVIPVVQLPREVHVMLLGTDCDGCFNASAAVEFLKQQKNLNITDVQELTIEQSKIHFDKYKIDRLPAVVVTGNVSNLTMQNFESKEDALIFSKAPPPYYDVASKQVKGKVTVVVLKDQTCTKCFNISQIAGQLGQAGVKVASERTVDSKSAEGKELISKYKIEKLPTIIFNKDALEYDLVKQVWSQVGSEESDGNLVLRLINPPYLNVSSGNLEGIVDVTYLADETCTKCFNASMLKDLLKQSFNMEFGTEKTVDVNSTKGKQLVKQYSIELVPTVILSKDAASYPSLAQAWPQAGTIENDGSFVMRQLELLEGQVYKNITSGEVKGEQKAEAEISTPQEADQ